MIIAFIGKQRSGKTVGMTQRVLAALDSGRVCYVNYAIKWDNMRPRGVFRMFLHRLGVWKIKRYPATNLRVFRDWSDVLNVAGATIALDEGWQYFDSYQKLPIDKRMRLYQSGKWEIDYLYTVQRYMMADINLRWSTDEFWESRLVKIPFVTYPLVIYKLYDLDDDNEGAKLLRHGLNEKGEVVDLALRTRLFVTRAKHFAVYDTKEDIYATQDARQQLGKKVDVRGDDTAAFVDPTPTYWYVLRHLLKSKYDDRRHTRAAPRNKARRENSVVEWPARRVRYYDVRDADRRPYAATARRNM